MPPHAETGPPSKPTLTFAWQELINDKCAIAGYQLQAMALAGSDAVDSHTFAAALARENISRITNKRILILPLNARQWDPSTLQFALSGNTFVRLDDLAPESGQSLETARQIISSGAQLLISSAIYNAIPNDQQGKSMVVFTLDAQPLNILEEQIRKIRTCTEMTKIIVSQVSSWSEFRYLMSLGVNYCMGSFTTTSEVIDNPKEISQSQLILLDMLNTLRNDGDTRKIAELAKRDPMIVLKFLELANSPISGLSRRVDTLDDAIFILGRENLYRWIALSVYRLGSSGQRDETLLTIALCRAAFLEALAPETNHKMSGELFLVGMFSLLESLLQQPMTTILTRLQLPDEVHAVLGRNDGPYIRYLMLALAMERCRLDNVIVLCDQLNLLPNDVFTHYRDAMAWASD